MRRHKNWKGLLALVLLVFAVAAPVKASESAPKSTVWLHVVNGNFAGEYNGKKYTGATSAEDASIEVTLDQGRRLPQAISTISATRTNGTFKGWYTRAPQEELVVKGEEGQQYSVWHTVKENGQQIQAGEVVPADVNVLYAVFADKNTEEEIADGDKLLTFYLDWNGIDGRYGPCLKCTRRYKTNGENTKFTAEDAAVFGLNYKADFDGEFKDKTGEDKWKALQTIWNREKFNGYIFLGWSLKSHGSNELIWQDTEIKNGMTFYAQWKKDDLSSDTFEPAADPDAGPLEFIRISGEGLNASLSVNKSARKGESITLTMLRGPIHAEAKDVTWILTVSDGKMKTKQIEVKADEPFSNTETGLQGLNIKAEGYNLTVTNTDGEEHAFYVGVKARSNEEGSAFISAPADATVGFSHNWRTTSKEPVDCRHSRCTDVCLVCGASRTYLASADNPQFHKYKETVTPMNCKQATLTKKCPICGQSTSMTIDLSTPEGPHVWGEWQKDADNPDQETRACKLCGKEESRPTAEAAARAAAKAAAGDPAPADSPAGDTSPAEPSVSDPPANQPSVDLPAENQLSTDAQADDSDEEKESEPTPQPENTGSNAAPAPQPQIVVPAPQLTSAASVSQPTSAASSAAPASQPASAAGNADPAPQTPIAAPAPQSVASPQSSQPVISSTAKTGWKQIGSKIYYLGKNGKKKTGWQKIGGKKYYFAKNGVMRTGWQKIGGKKYYFDKNGVMQTGWLKLGKNTYYLGKNGVMRTGKQKIGKKKYYFNKNGVLK